MLYCSSIAVLLILILRLLLPCLFVSAAIQSRGGFLISLLVLSSAFSLCPCTASVFICLISDYGVIFDLLIPPGAAAVSVK